MRRFDFAIFLALLTSCTHSNPTEPDANEPALGDASDPDAGDPGGGSASVRSLGTVHDMATVSCASINGHGDSCRTFTVSCPGVQDLTGMLAITEPTTVTRTVVILGPGGGTHFYDVNPGFVAGYAQLGFRVVQLAWTTDWEAAGSGSPASITASACRTSTMFHWVSTNLANIPSRQPFCVHGSSGGSGALAYALSRYGLKSEIDHGMFSFGPVFSRIDYGCAESTYQGGARDVCPQDTAAFFHYTPNSEALIDSWEGTQGCATNTPPLDDVPQWRADSTMTSDADLEFPNTSMSFFYCTSPANAGAGQGSFFTTAVHSVHSSTSCFSDCSEEMLQPQNVTAMIADMDANCVLHP